MQAKHYNWAGLPQDHPVDKIDRRRVVGDNMMVAEITLYKGFHVATHQHPSEQICLVLSGALKFVIGAEGSPDCYEVVVKAGEVLQLPGNIPHSADALEDSTLFDLFSPIELSMGVDQQHGQ